LARGTLLPHGPLAHNFEISDEFPPIPSVILFEDLLLAPFESSLRFDGHGSFEMAVESLLVEVRIWREMRLAIGPVDQIERPGPLFEVRTRVDISADNRPVLLQRPWLYLSGPENVEVIRDHKRYTARIDFSPETPFGSEKEADSRALLEGPGLGHSGGPLQPEHVYVVWYPVTPATCLKLLNRPLSTDTSVFRLRVPESQTETFLPSGTIGGAIEAALLTEDGYRVDLELAKEARRLGEMVTTYSIKSRAKANNLHLQRLARWRLK
jgi:hypothetical protein